ncbi:MAG TPA: glycosyltransferase family 2 protein [Thermoanaerobaculia bacterium]|nr:glycosyltransferase family 2 protein [Thermoanaerobaculia bacterium]
MTTLASVLLALALVLVLWSYLVYPELVTRLANRTTPRKATLPIAPSVEVLISAFNEQETIGPRIENLVAQEYPGRLTVSIGCDGCRDWTAIRAREVGGERVKVGEFAERRGKAAVLNELVRRSEGEILVFTDANSEFARDAVMRIVTPFADPDVGAVCGRLKLEDPNGSESPETEFWNHEMRLKAAEGRLGVCLGGNGAIYAARRELIRPIPAGSAMDDFLIPAYIARQGKKVVFAGDAVAREPAAPTVRDEMARRFRIGVGAGRVLRSETWLFDSRRHPLLTLAFLSRKVARWLAPVVFLAATFAALGSEVLRFVALGVLLAAAVAALAAKEVRRVRGFAGRLYYFGVINLALAAGVVPGLFGYRRAIWKPTGRTGSP